ncbi:hypothetical protein BDQ12DRAFT_686594 [Crucibulum laeve]|uniref:Ras GEF n=1 Tax=Crucibulum laeve TaxID=68775 RepID=A0A5C3LUB1_9AGAR|nr:hypothetical protein BDQ12DRAFT_686594 [Crucibulum laeve]
MSTLPNEFTNDTSRPDTPLASIQSSAPQIPLPETLKAISVDDLTPDISSLHVSAQPSGDSLLPTPSLPTSKSQSSLTFVEPVIEGIKVDGGHTQGTSVETYTASDGSLDEQMREPETDDATTRYEEQQRAGSSIKSAPSSEHTPARFLLPIPTLQPNRSQTSFTFSDVIDEAGAMGPLPPEIAAADIVIAPDGTFVETSSGPAARELKRRYDQQYGVTVSIRSPYAITAFVNQHGKQMFRIGARELSAPGLSAVEAAEATESVKTSTDSSQSTWSKRKSRISVHTLLPQFNKAGSTSIRPQTSAVQQPRKLRKTRSIPDLVSIAVGTSQAAVPPSQPGTVSTLTGRAHSHSVTSADISRFSAVNARYNAPRRGDIFGEMMDWSAPSTSASTSFSTHSLTLPGESPSMGPFEHGKSRAFIGQPFGAGVSFESPSRRPNTDFLPTPRLLREMQSFESGLTARQDSRPSQDSPISPEIDSPDSEASRPPSAIRLTAIIPSQSSKSENSTVVGGATDPVYIPPEESAFALSPETSMVSHYSTDVFDVLQTYRGLPLLEKLSPDTEGTTVIKLSLSHDESAAPRNDPRFVIWGEIQSDWDDESSASRDSLTDMSSAPSSSLSKRRSGKAKAKSPEPPTLRLPIGEGKQKVLVAATIERWIAQLTSDLNYDELLDFFLTYRTYVSAVDLCHLLICRFHWALQQSTSARDETARHIVRVRTFVAIRYWLLTFFTVDFLPNRELRLLIANWLNTLIRDPILKKHNDGLGIVRRLIKVAKDCKQAHTRQTAKPQPEGPGRPAGSAPQAGPSKPHLFGENFSEATRKLATDDDGDLDLDFLLEEPIPSDSSTGIPHDPANALNVNHLGAGFSPNRPVSLPLSSLTILQRTDHAPGPAEKDTPLVYTPSALPVHNSALSRAFVKTIGRLGRWKRVLNSRSAPRNVSAFDLEYRTSQDMFTMNGAAGNHIRMIQSQSSPVSKPLSPPSAPAPISQPTKIILPEKVVVRSPEAAELPPPAQEDLREASNDKESQTAPVGSELPPTYVDSERDLPPVPPSPIPSVRELEQSTELNGDYLQASPSVKQMSDRASSFRSSSTDSLGIPLEEGGAQRTFPRVQPQWGFDVVSIDELDFSDTSSDVHAPGPPQPPGLRRPDRKLPLRRDFEFVQRPESVSSMGIVSHDSMASGPSSGPSSLSFTGVGGNIQQWHLNSLVDSLSNDEESGDVEAALRRLEGQVNPEKQREKALKVDGWVRTIQERMAAGDYGDEESRFPDDDDDDDEDHDNDSRYDESSSQHDTSVATPSISEPDEPFSDDANLDNVNTPVPSQTTHNITFPPGLNTSSPRSNSNEAKPAPEDVVPLEILESRVSPEEAASSPTTLSLSNFTSEIPRVHRSFILSLTPSAEMLAQHFAMIDRDLFMGVKFEELVLDDWMGCEEINILDWTQYLKDRATWKAESRFPDKTSALGAVRARFNLLANFVISEVVLTHPSERHILVAKFIRIAWKSYAISNFNSLTAIITGLQSEWVSKAMKRSAWNRIGAFESRAFRDLKKFVAGTDDFKIMRDIVDSIADAKPLDGSSHAASVVSGGGGTEQSGRGRSGSENRLPVPTACIPFIGIYLSQLRRLSKLPDLIDPTAPNETVGIDPVTANFDPPAHPEVFSALAPLPPSIHLEPLINVHKQRRIAAVIKSLVAGQHLASRMKFEVDKKLSLKCLRLRCVDMESLQRSLALHSD